MNVERYERESNAITGICYTLLLFVILIGIIVHDWFAAIGWSFGTWMMYNRDCILEKWGDSLRQK